MGLPNRITVKKASNPRMYIRLWTISGIVRCQPAARRPCSNPLERARGQEQGARDPPVAHARDGVCVCGGGGGGLPSRFHAVRRAEID